VIELGAERAYRHERFFPHASRYRLTNVARDADEHLDVTDMDLPDASVDGFVCISVLEHVFEIQRATSEIGRALRPGGKLLMTVPFGYPYHDEVDYWRLQVDAYEELLQGLEIRAFVHLGGTFSTIAENLKRPRRSFRKRFLVYKGLGLILTTCFGRLDCLDGMPLGYGVLAEKPTTPVG